MRALFRSGFVPFAALVGLIAAGCSANGRLATSALSASTTEQIVLPRYSGSEVPLELIVRSTQAWREAWVQLWPNAADRPTLSEVDFERKMVIAASLGARPSGGFGIELALIDAGDHMSARITELTPDVSCVAAAVVTYPTRILVVEKQAKDVRFVRESRVRTCH